MSKQEENKKTYKSLPPQQKAIETEADVLKYWEDKKIFERSVEERPADKPFVFYEGPPTANGRPGVHHAMSRTIKDLVCRYQTMRGHRVVRKAGWDTHGLPVEIEVEHKLGLDGKDQIEKYGIAAFNEECKKSVFTYLDEWHEFTRKLGFWLDLGDPYVTFHNSYIESVWWILKQFWDAFEKAGDEVITDSGNDFLKALGKLEAAIDKKPMYDRITAILQSATKQK